MSRLRKAMKVLRTEGIRVFLKKVWKKMCGYLRTAALPSCDHKKAAVLAEEACIQESGQVQHYYASL